MIKVVLVDDSLLALKMLEQALSSAADIKVIAKTQSAREALEIIPLVSPDVVCLDLHMPDMNGLELTKEILHRFPLPILVCSVSVYPGDKDNVFNLLEAGAVDVIPKPISPQEADYQKAAEELISKVRIASRVRAVHRIIREKPAVVISGEREKFAANDFGFTRVIAIGVSTGGPQTLKPIFSQLPADFSCPIICIQHISKDFQQNFIDWLAGLCKIKIQVAREGEIPSPGKIYFPESGTHLKIDNKGRFQLFLEPSTEAYIPSINITFSSLAAYYGKAVMGIILTGMGNDGVAGLLKINQAGGVTIAQNEESCVIYGMPKEAIEAKAARYILSSEEITRLLLKL